MICIWSSQYHCHPVISCFIKMKIALTVLGPAYPGCPGKESVEWVSVVYVFTVGSVRDRPVVKAAVPLHSGVPEA